MFLAAFFLRHGYSVNSFDAKKPKSSIPDLYIRGNPLPALIAEVYRPRDLEGLDRFHDALWNALRHAEVPWQFHASIHLDQPFGQKDSVVRAFSRFLDSDAVITRIVNEISEALFQQLTDGIPHPKHTWKHDGCCIRVISRLVGVEQATNVTPRRGFVLTELGLLRNDSPGIASGDLILRCQSKLSKQQTSAVKRDGLRALFVDYSKLSYADDFDDPYHLRPIASKMEACLDLGITGHDALILFKRKDNGLQFPVILCRTPHLVPSVEGLLCLSDRHRLTDRVSYGSSLSEPPSDPLCS